MKTFGVMLLLLVLGALGDEDALRSRLRKMTSRELLGLARKHGVDDEIPRKGAIEKGDIIKVLLEVVLESERKERRRYRMKLIRDLVAVGLATAAVAFLWTPVSGFLGSSLTRLRFELEQKYDLIFTAMNAGSPLAAAGVLFCAWLELVTSLIRYSVLLSWVLPRTSFLRRFLITTYIPALPIDVGAVGGNVLGVQGRSWNIDVMPVVIMYLMGRLHRRLASFVGTRMTVVRRRRRS